MTEESLSPALLRALLDIYTTPDTQPHTGIMAELATLNLATNTFNFPRLTERGRAHLIQVLRLPLPRKAWLDASGAEIKDTALPVQKNA